MTSSKIVERPNNVLTLYLATLLLVNRIPDLGNYWNPIDNDTLFKINYIIKEMSFSINLFLNLATAVAFYYWITSKRVVVATIHAAFIASYSLHIAAFFITQYQFLRLETLVTNIDDMESYFLIDVTYEQRFRAITRFLNLGAAVLAFGVWLLSTRCAVTTKAS